MATQAAYAAEQAIGHQGDSVTAQDVTNYGTVGDDAETMKALVWQAKNKVEIGKFSCPKACPRMPLTPGDSVEVPKPKIIEDSDVILRVTGSTVCGSDLHLLHGSVVQMSKGDILGHEFCGVVDQVGSSVTNVKVGHRYVASFQIACGNVRTILQEFPGVTSTDTHPVLLLQTEAIIPV